METTTEQVEELVGDAEFAREHYLARMSQYDAIKQDVEGAVSRLLGHDIDDDWVDCGTATSGRTDKQTMMAIVDYWTGSPSVWSLIRQFIKFADRESADPASDIFSFFSVFGIDRSKEVLEGNINLLILDLRADGQDGPASFLDWIAGNQLGIWTVQHDSVRKFLLPIMSFSSSSTAQAKLLSHTGIAAVTDTRMDAYVSECRDKTAVRKEFLTRNRVQKYLSVDNLAEPTTVTVTHGFGPDPISRQIHQDGRVPAMDYAIRSVHPISQLVPLLAWSPFPSGPVGIPPPTHHYTAFKRAYLDWLTRTFSTTSTSPLKMLVNHVSADVDRYFLTHMAFLELRSRFTDAHGCDLASGLDGVDGRLIEQINTVDAPFAIIMKRIADARLDGQ